MSDGHSINIRRGKLSAEVKLLGAELWSLRIGAQELLWQVDEHFWHSRSPLLFPVVGKVKDGKISVQGKVYDMPSHGFARSSYFTVLDQQPDSCTLALRHTPTTALIYPFEFELRVRYLVTESELCVMAWIFNTGTVVLPASFGFHPTFRWPLEAQYRKDEYVVVFPNDSILDVYSLNRSGLLNSDPVLFTLAPGGVLKLDDSLFQEDALIFLHRNSANLRYATKSGRGMSIEIRTFNLPELGLWMKPGGRFISIEPWSGTADPDVPYGDLFQKPRINLIKPGNSVAFSMHLALV